MDDLISLLSQLWSQLSLTVSLISLLAVPVLDIITELVCFVQTADTSIFRLDGTLLRKSSVSSTTDHSFIVLTILVIELGITLFWTALITILDNRSVGHQLPRH